MEQPQQPQPTARRQAPPPIPQDRLSSQPSLNRQNISAIANDSEPTSSSYTSRQQQYQTQPYNEPIRGGAQQSSNSQQGSMRQGPQVTTTTTTQYMREFESSRSTSITSTPDVNRLKKQILVNDPNVNHKDVNTSNFLTF